MKIYLITLKECDYDQYDSFVVIAEDKDRAWKLIRIEHSQDSNIYTENIEEIREIGISNTVKEEIVLGSFNAG